MNSTEWTFWRFLDENEIEIPIIQRDYAQGRTGKEELRKSFLRDLTDALGTNKRMKLDFVYGTNENGVLIPLDGQQRLTTLWLLHWYVAYRAQKLDEPTVERLRKFSYKTRLSSRQFCEKLAGFSELPPDDLDVASHIRNQVWFRRAWRNDPTIQSMLRMISGTPEGKSDGIEGVVNSQQSADYWNKLTSSDCPIVFYHLNLYGISHSDDLYIKMNARGKPLTSFENLKADLAGYISRQAANEPNEDGMWHHLDSAVDGLAIKMDTDWTNGIFWKNKSDSDCAIDEIYFAFLNRFFLNAHVQNMAKADVKKGDDKIFDFFYGHDANSEVSDDRIAYIGFDSAYERLIENKPEILKCLTDTLENLNAFFGVEDEKIFQSPWDEDGNFRFVPCYKSPSGLHSDFAGNQIRRIATITQSHRVVFHAVCKFFEQEWRDEDGDALKNWMRVVWNIVVNADINTIPGMIGCLRLVDELAEHSHRILEGLRDHGASLKSDFAKVQVEEEIEKAKQILSDTAGTWKKKIEQAEKTAFFKGAIRFLYKNGNGEVDWNDFDVKLKNAETFFQENGVREEYRINALLLRSFLAKEQLKAESSGFGFGHGKNFWRKVLLEACFFKTVDELLKSDVLAVSNGAAEWITDADLIADVINGDEGPLDCVWRILSGWKSPGDKTLTRYANRVSGKVNYPNLIIPISGFADSSLQIMRQDCLTSDMICNSPQRRGSKWLVGWTSDVEFQYDGHWFLWKGAPIRDEGEYDIYLLKEKWKDDSSYATHSEDWLKYGDEKKFYCFDVDCKDDFKKNLERLIENYLKKS